MIVRTLVVHGARGRVAGKKSAAGAGGDAHAHADRVDARPARLHRSEAVFAVPVADPQPMLCDHLHRRVRCRRGGLRRPGAGVWMGGSPRIPGAGSERRPGRAGHRLAGIRPLRRSLRPQDRARGVRRPVRDILDRVRVRRQSRPPHLAPFPDRAGSRGRHAQRDRPDGGVLPGAEPLYPRGPDVLGLHLRQRARRLHRGLSDPPFRLAERLHRRRYRSDPAGRPPGLLPP